MNELKSIYKRLDIRRWGKDGTGRAPVWREDGVHGHRVETPPPPPLMKKETNMAENIIFLQLSWLSLKLSCTYKILDKYS